MRIKPILKSFTAINSCYKLFKKKISKRKYQYNKLFSRELDIISLKKGFAKIGIKPNDKIVVSSSLSSFGFVKGGATTIVNALMEYITPRGLIVMPTYPHTNMYKYLESNPVFSVLQSPSKNGEITDVFRKCNDVYRSCHPTHCIAAWGTGARDLVRNHHLSETPYATNSPYKKMLEMNIKTVLFGVNLNHAIMIRVIDDLYPDYPLSPYIPDKLYRIRSIDYDGNEYIVTTPCHDPEYSKERNNMAIYPYIKPLALLGKLGMAKTIVFNSQDLFNKQVELSKIGVFPFYRLPLKNREMNV